MSELVIRNGEPIDTVADASLEDAGIEGAWIKDEFNVYFVRDGDAIAGFSLNEQGVKSLYALLGAALKTRRTA